MGISDNIVSIMSINQIISEIEDICDFLGYKMQIFNSVDFEYGGKSVFVMYRVLINTPSGEKNYIYSGNNPNKVMKEALIAALKDLNKERYITRGDHLYL